MTSVQERADLLSKLGLDGQNKAALGQVLGTGRIGQATERADVAALWDAVRGAAEAGG